jgi:hypothetical protein
LEKKQDRKQIKVTDMQDRLSIIRHKAAFLHEAVMPIGGREHYHAQFTYEGSEGLSAILGEIADELAEIGDAEIIGHQGSAPLPLRKEA